MSFFTLLWTSLHCQHHMLTYEVSYCFAAVQHWIIDTNKTGTGIGSIDTLVSVLPITTSGVFNNWGEREWAPFYGSQRELCLSVCLSVCHGPSTYHKSLPALILHILCHALIQNHGQSNSTMVTTRMETTHRPTYLMARATDITSWQSVDAICLCCLTHGAYVKVTGLQPLLTTVRWRLSVAHVKEDCYSAVICQCHLHDLQHVLDQLCAACLYIVARPDSQFLCTLCTFFL